MDQEQFKSSIEYYKNNPESLVPNLVLLKTANDEVQLSKLESILNDQYIQNKLTLSNYKSLQESNKRIV